MPAKSAIERAFELAQSGEVGKVEDIRRRLQAEGLDEKLVYGPTLWRQLRALIREARKRQLMSDG